MLQPQLQAAVLDENDDDDGDGMEAAGNGVEKPRFYFQEQNCSSK